MWIKIARETSPGCTWRPGTIVKVTDKQAQRFIDQGIAVPAGDPVTLPRQKIPGAESNPFFQPPRYICGCGFVAKSTDELVEHERNCT